MQKSTKLFGLTAAALLAAMTGAQAQATRTWVSGVGDDVNPCSRTAPCKTFPGAISKTAAGGEIDVLDPGGFGAVTITKSITIDGSGGSIAGVLVSGQNGMVINDSGAGTVNVTIRNIDFEGLGFSTAGSGIRGIWFVSGGVLNVQHCVIRNFRDPTNGTGIAFTPSTPAKLFVDDTILTGNGNANTGAIMVAPTADTANSTLLLTSVRAEGNTGAGLKIDVTGRNTLTVKGAVSDSAFGGNSTNGIMAVAPTGASAATVNLNIDRVVSSNNTAAGIFANGDHATINVGRSVVSGNAVGFALPSSGIIKSYGDNSADGNGAPGTPILPNLTRL